MVTIDITNKINELKMNPAQVLVLGFAALILIGATLLNLPLSSVDGKSIGFVDALFTSASAVCVTGLVVVNTATHWTIFGKVIILILIQIGGLGFMTMATLVALFLGKKITLKDRLIMQEELNQFSLSGLVKLTKYVIISTFIIEALGAVFLSFRFIDTYGLVKGVWFSIFHSVSAFCNAGFDLIGDSLVMFVADPLMNFTIGILVIIGGLGYTVYMDITVKKSFRKLSLHSKFVLLLSAILLVFALVFFFIMEYTNPETLGRLSFGSKILASMFQSIIPRTAGFNTIDIASIRSATAFIIIILMFIGGSPSSTAGGIKTTTIGVIGLGIVSVIKGKKDVEIFKRRVPIDIILRALAVTGIGLTLVLMITILLTITETNASFLDVLFEVTSAFGTVGLSRGLTSNLSVIGKILITVTMFAGRVGPLTMAFAFAKKQKDNKGFYRYPEERIIVG